MRDFQKIERSILKASESLRSLLPTGEYKYYILPILFLRLLYDYIKISKKYDLESDSDDLRDLQQRIFFLFNNKFAASGNEIKEIFKDVEFCFPNELTSVFSVFDLSSNRLGSEEQQKIALANIFNVLSSPPFSFQSTFNSKELLGEIFKNSIAVLALNSKGNFEYITPPEISILISRIVSTNNKDIQTKKTYYDPACGSGSLLSTCATTEKNLGNDVELYGQEKSGAAWAIAKLNLFLHGSKNVTIALSDSLRAPPVDDDGNLLRFDVAVSNPPWNLKNWESSITNSDPFQIFKFGVPKSSADYAFALQMLAMLKRPNGVMAIIVPNGVLFRSGSDDTIRRNLIENNFIDTIISLPQKLFYNTAIPANIIIFKTNKKDNKVFFINWSEVDVFPKGVSKLSSTAIEKIVDLYDRKVDFRGVSRLVEISEIHDNDFNLTTNRYIQQEDEILAVDLYALRRKKQEIQREIDCLTIKLEQAINNAENDIKVI